MTKFIDCISYFDEDLLFDLRLNELNNYIDYFIVVESTQTHQGKKKKLNFDIRKFRKFSKKIIYLVNDNLDVDLYSHPDEKIPFNGNPDWKREHSQRNYLMKAINNFDKNDCIIISDADEIPRGEIIRKSYKSTKEYYNFVQNFYYYKLNGFIDCNWQGSIMTAKKNIKSPCWLVRNRRSKKKIFNDFRKNIKVIKNGGWHFSYLKTPDQIIKKINSFAHREYNVDLLKNLTYIENCIKNSEDIFKSLRPKTHRVNIKKVNLDNTYPNYVLKNLDIFRNWIIK
jgi:beta-1,4-mannosyl-glycoprotein beta-1,4-N-acetylglucosaminyltransferase